MQIDSLIQDFLDEAKYDYISFGAIVADVQRDLNDVDYDSIFDNSFKVIRALIANGYYPGDYTADTLKKGGLSFWSGASDELIRRMEKAWVDLRRLPDLGDICWFGLKPN